MTANEINFIINNHRRLNALYYRSIGTKLILSSPTVSEIDTIISHSKNFQYAYSARVITAYKNFIKRGKI